VGGSGLAVGHGNVDDAPALTQQLARAARLCRQRGEEVERLPDPDPLRQSRLLQLAADSAA
jgi:hypothetical protein